MEKKVGSRAPRPINRVKIYLIAAVVIIVFLPSVIKHQQLRLKCRRLETKIAEVNRVNARLENEKIRLQTDITYIEKRAREQMGLVRKGEIVLKESPEED